MFLTVGFAQDNYKLVWSDEFNQDGLLDSTVWNYVGICNQILAALVLWTVTAYLIGAGKPHWITSVPATFLTFVCVSYFMMAPYKSGGLYLSPVIGYVIGAAVAMAVFTYTAVRAGRSGK